MQSALSTKLEMSCNNESFECVWPSCGVGAERVNVSNGTLGIKLKTLWGPEGPWFMESFLETQPSL